MVAENMVYVLDDDKRIRESLYALLSSVGYAVSTFGDPDTFLAHEKPDVPSCLILDQNLGKTTGLDLQQKLTDEAELPVIFLTGTRDIRTAVKAMRNGASEILSKPVLEEELLPAVKAALAQAHEQWGERVIRGELRRRYATLTLRERGVLPFIVKGMLNKQTAYELGTSEITIRIHRGKIMRKMKADSLADLVRIAARLRIPLPRNT